MEELVLFQGQRMPRSYLERQIDAFRRLNSGQNLDSVPARRALAMIQALTVHDLNKRAHGS